MQLFNLGTYLRETYDKFLGSLYFEDIAEMRTTAFSVSIIAGELINTGLWPPTDSQIWKEDFIWQPIPFGTSFLTRHDVKDLIHKKRLDLD
jgi:hypothetical protein